MVYSIFKSCETITAINFNHPKKEPEAVTPNFPLNHHPHTPIPVLITH